MNTEVTIVLHDPNGRSQEWWFDYMQEMATDADAEVVEIETE